jgi:hypothetical protein
MIDNVVHLKSDVKLINRSIINMYITKYFKPDMYFCAKAISLPS